MALPCVDCLVLARCVNRRLSDLWRECEQLRNFVFRTLELTDIIIIRNSSNLKNILAMRYGKPVLSLGYPPDYEINTDGDFIEIRR